MMLFCTTPHGLLDDNDTFGAAERKRQRRVSLPGPGARLAGVKRVASFGGKRSASGSASRRAAQPNLKALISQPRDFVHVSHGDNSAILTTSREIIGIDLNLLQRVVAGSDNHEFTSPVVNPIPVIEESPAEDGPTSARTDDSTTSPTTPTPITTPTPTMPLDDEAAKRQSRRTSMMKRKAVPAYDSETVTMTDSVSSSPVNSVASPSSATISPLASAAEPEFAAAC